MDSHAPSYVVPWEDVLAYFKECRERALQELAGAEDVRAVGKAQGKIELCNELLNLRSVFETLYQAQEDAAPKPPDARALAREAYRIQLQGPHVAP